MEVDSMHSAIETAKKHKPVYTIHDWVKYMIAARRTEPGPFKVKILRYTDFYDGKALADSIMRNIRKLDDGSSFKWTCVKSFQYRRDEPGVVGIKLDYEQEEYSKLRVI